MDKIKKEKKEYASYNIENYTINSLNLPICDEPASTKYITLHIHYMLKNDGSGNFNETNDGLVGQSVHIPGVTGYTRAQQFVNQANTKMYENYQMFLPNPNSLPIMPKRVQFIIGSVSFHRNTTWYNTALFDFSIDNVYGVNRGSSINVYFTRDPNDPTTAYASEIPESATSFLATRIQDWGYFYPQWPNWDGIGHTLCHEVGHLLGLYHDWGPNNVDDLCEDTPFHNNCWTYNHQNPKCDEWSEISNNTMSYIGGYQEALSPCQIDRIQTRLNTYLSPYVTYCDVLCDIANPYFTLSENEFCLSNINQDLYLDASANGAYGDYRLIIERNGGPIYDQPFTQNVSGLNLSNYTGINFSAYQDCPAEYTVIMKGDNFPDCPSEHTYLQNFYVYDISNPLCGYNFMVMPNPNNGNFNISYNVKNKEKVHIYLTNKYGMNKIDIVKKGTEVEGDFKMSLNFDQLQPDIYIITLDRENGKPVKKSITIVK